MYVIYTSSFLNKWLWNYLKFADVRKILDTAIGAIVLAWLAEISLEFSTFSRRNATALKGRKTGGDKIPPRQWAPPSRASERLYIRAITRMTRKVGAVESARTKGGESEERAGKKKRVPQRVEGGRKTNERQKATEGSGQTGGQRERKERRTINVRTTTPR